MHHILNGELIEESDLSITVRDLGLLRGYAIFDYFITYNKRPFKLEDHIDRLFNSAQAIDLDIPYTKDAIREMIFKIIKENKDLGQLSVKIIVTGGESSDGFFPDQKSNVIILVDPRHIPSKEHYEEGVSIKTDDFVRQIPEAKSNNYIEAIKSVKQAKREGFYDVLYIHNGQVLELTRSNIFTVINNELVTPKTHILEGVTRNILLEILKLNIPVKESDFTLDDLLTSKEAFLTASNSEVMPITQINGKKIGDGKVGKITKEVMKQFREYTESGKW